MAIDALVQPLLALPIFRGLTPLQLTEIVRRAERIIYRPGDALTTENEMSDAAIIIISGSCLRVDDSGDPSQKSRGEIVPEGAMIAELAMLIDFPHTSTIIAQGAVKALRLTREKTLEFMQEEPDLAEHFCAIITARLKLLANDLKAIATGGDDATISPRLQRPKVEQTVVSQAT
ncbi:MAG: cyclic nucleotide-binding domain-containing protein [Hyphomicrobium sp.]|uniref:cyclic nucleotide-binding domain-containing protein n=1 Tax=Hyphomicrobium sp. TaxID=82 RepID=UPI0039E50154